MGFSHVDRISYFVIFFEFPYGFTMFYFVFNFCIDFDFDDSTKDQIYA